MGTEIAGKSVRKNRKGRRGGSGAGHPCMRKPLVQSPVLKEEKEKPQHGLKEHSPKTTVLEKGSKNIM